MRGTVPGLPTPHPLVYRLPAVYLEQDFLRRFLEALDEVLAPVLLVLDNLAAHLDPRTAPEDLLAWVAGWLAVEADSDRPVGQRRAVVTEAVARHGRRGTRRGLAEAVHLEVGVEPEITETGGAAWSATPHGALPGTPVPSVTVRVRVAEPDRVDLVRLEQLVAAEVPAHVGYRIDLASTGDAS